VELLANSRRSTFKILHEKTNTPTTTFVGESHSTLEIAGEAQVLILAANLQIFKMSNAELATSYAALILADDGVDITVRLFLLRDPAHWAL
jgi:hypothetical protein